MAIRQIRIWPDPALTDVGEKVTDFGREIDTLVRDLFDTMYAANGIGLSATQIAVPQRILVLDLDPKKDRYTSAEFDKRLTEWGFKKAQEFVNPVIVEGEGDIIWEEGCLSVPGFTDRVKRKRWIRVQAQDRNGDTFELEAEGLYAVALQHEMDHLDGKVFVEYLSKLKRDVVKRKMRRMKNEHEEDGVLAAQFIAGGG